MAVSSAASATSGCPSSVATIARRWSPVQSPPRRAFIRSWEREIMIVAGVWGWPRSERAAFEKHHRHGGDGDFLLSEDRGDEGETAQAVAVAAGDGTHLLLGHRLHDGSSLMMSV